MPRLTPAALVGLLLTACLPTARPALTLLPARAPQAAATEAAEAFHTAAGPAGLRGALAELRRAAPGSALYHEAAATVALLDLRTDDAFEHLLQALRDLGGDAPLLNLQRFWELPYTAHQRRRAVRLFERLAEEHPSRTSGPRPPGASPGCCGPRGTRPGRGLPGSRWACRSTWR